MKWAKTTLNSAFGGWVECSAPREWLDGNVLDVTTMPTADADEMLRLIGALAADAVTDDDGRCWFCADLPGYEDEDEHAPDCDLEKARAFLKGKG